MYGRDEANAWRPKKPKKTKAVGVLERFLEGVHRRASPPYFLTFFFLLFSDYFSSQFVYLFFFLFLFYAFLLRLPTESSILSSLRFLSPCFCSVLIT